MKKTGPKPIYNEAADKRLVVRLTETERNKWKEKAEQSGFSSLSDMIRTLMAAA